MERELLMTGIGGQGVQLAGQLLARAAVSAGRQVLMFGSYGGMMRGGNTDVTLILADSAVKSPPTVSRAWSALVMHSAFAVGTLTRLCPDGILIVNTTVLTELPDHPPGATVAIPASGVAIELGTAAAATMVALGAYTAATRIVDLDALVAALPEAMPPYRSQHIAGNERALRAGAALVPGVVRAAWPATPTPLATAVTS